MARPRKYSDEEIITALVAERGMVYRAADKVGCEPDTIYNRAKVSPAVEAAMRKERGKVVDLAETKLFDAIEKGEQWAIQMTLRCLGKDRGYVERQEVEQTQRARLVIEEEVVGRTGDDHPAGEAARGPGGVPS